MICQSYYFYYCRGCRKRCRVEAIFETNGRPSPRPSRGVYRWDDRFSWLPAERGRLKSKRAFILSSENSTTGCSALKLLNPASARTEAAPRSKLRQIYIDHISQTTISRWIATPQAHSPWSYAVWFPVYTNTIVQPLNLATHKSFFI